MISLDTTLVFRPRRLELRPIGLDVRECLNCGHAAWNHDGSTLCVCPNVTRNTRRGDKALTLTCPHCHKLVILSMTVIGWRLNCEHCRAFLSVETDVSTTEPMLVSRCSWCDEVITKRRGGFPGLFCNDNHKSIFRYWNVTKPAIAKSRKIDPLQPIRVFDIISPSKPS